MQRIQLTGDITENQANQRLDQALSQTFSLYSRSQLQQWIKAGFVTVDGKAWTRPRDKVSGGEHININANIEAKENWEAQPIGLNIAYEDDELLVINKPVGLVVHPGAGNPDLTLVNAIVNHHPANASLPRAGLIHRLDKNTSGLLVIAKTLETHNALVKMLEARDMKREYMALVNGLMISGGTIEADIARHPTARTKMSVVRSGRAAITHYRVEEKFRAHTLVRVQLETGRTHQIRVHMAHINFPVIGDLTYGHRRIPAKLNESLRDALHHFNHQALHAFRLSLEHPVTGEMMSWEAPLPEDMQQLIALLREDNEHQK